MSLVLDGWMGGGGDWGSLQGKIEKHNHTHFLYQNSSLLQNVLTWLHAHLQGVFHAYFLAVMTGVYSKFLFCNLTLGHCMNLCISL